MKTWSKQKQRGVSLTGLVFVIAVLGVLSVLGMKIVPTVSEYMDIKKAVNTAKSSGSTPTEIRASFDKIAAAGYIDSVSGKDLEITPQNGVMEVSFSYEKRIPLVGPASLVLDYEGSTAGTAKKKKTIE